MVGAWAGTPLFTEGLLAALILLIVVLDALFWPRRPSANLGYLTLCGLLVALSAALEEWTYGVNSTAFHDLVFLDTYATFFDILVLAVALCTVLLALGGIQGERVRGEFYPLLLISVLGVMLTASAADLLVVYLGLEMVTLPLWVLTALGHRRGTGVEAGFKFLILGLFGSGLVLFAIALLYGAAGGTGLQLLVESLSSSAADNKLVVPAVVLLLAGLLLKLGAAPFHAWSPDVCQGSPLAVSVFVSAGVPAAGLAALGRVLLYGLVPVEALWMPLLEAAAVLSLVCGSLLALNQRNIRRLLAYVGIAQVGVGLVGLLAVNEAGLVGMLFGAVGSALALAGCYAIMVICGPESPDLRDYRGLGRQQPLLALGFACCLASLVGLPPTAGFVGRFYVLTAALETGRVALAFAVAGCFPLLVYACLRGIGSVFTGTPSADPPKIYMRAEALVVLLLSVLGTLSLGVLPAALLRAARETVVAVM